jgi:hypothetical protein
MFTKTATALAIIVGTGSGALTRTMSYTLGIALLSLLLCFPARAQKIEVGTGIFCDTQKQVERFVALFDGNAENAIKAVNAEENDPTACASGMIAFIRGPEITTARTKNGTFHIVRVLVVGDLTEAGFRTTVPTAFFSFERVDERVA